MSVAAITTAGLIPSAQSAFAQSDGEESSSNLTDHVEFSTIDRPPLFDALTDSEELEQKEPVVRTGPIVYLVQPGDEVREIARGFGLQTMTVVWNNDLPDPDLIFPDQELLILPVDGILVEVAPGDTLNDLATTYGVSTAAVVNYEPNGITNPDLIHPGQTLIIPGGKRPQSVAIDTQQDEISIHPPDESDGPSQTTAPAPIIEESAEIVGEVGDSVEVTPGDTLASVAQRFGVTIDELARTNRIADVDLIHPGDILYMPDGDGVQIPPIETEASPVEPQFDTDDESTSAQVPESAGEPETDPTPEPSPTETPEPAVTQAPEPTATPAPDPTPDPAPEQQTGAPSDIPGMLEYYANQYGLDPDLVKALAWLESGWDQSARNPSGATGVMQIMPGTGTWIDNNLIDRPIDIYNSAEDNIQAGTAYLHHMIEISGSVERGLASYYQGPGHVQRNGVNENARKYIDSIMKIRNYLREHGEPPPFRR